MALGIKTCNLDKHGYLTSADDLLASSVNALANHAKNAVTAPGAKLLGEAAVEVHDAVGIAASLGTMKVFQMKMVFLGSLMEMELMMANLVINPL